MPKVVDILKARWMEVLLLVGFQTGVLFLLEPIVVAAEGQAEGKPVTMPNDTAFLLGLGTMGFIIVWQMLYLGFLRTAYVEGCTRWDPGPLLRIGRFYFWRVVRFQVLLLLVYSALAMAAMSAAAALMHKEPEKLPAWVEMSSAFAISIALMKLAAFSPPIMVARNVMVFRSIGLLGQYRLMQARAIPLVYIGALFFSAAVSLADNVFSPKGALHYAVMGCHHVVIGVATLAVHLTALRLIRASEPPVPVEAEGEPGEPTDESM